MGRRPKLEFKINCPTRLTTIFDDCVEGINTYGKPYALYAVEAEGQEGLQEYALFADPPLHDRLKNMKKGQSIIVTKKAVQKKNRVAFSYEFQMPNESPKSVPTAKPIAEVIPEVLSKIPVTTSTDEYEEDPDKEHDQYFSIMRRSYSEAIELNSELNGMADPARIAITLFIARTKNLNS